MIRNRINESNYIAVHLNGSRSGAYMAWWLKENKSEELDLVFIFCNTGREREETLEFMNECDKAFGLNLVWLEAVVDFSGYGNGHGIKAKVVTFETANRDGSVFESVIAKHGIPHRDFTFCNGYMKDNVLKAYVNGIGWGYDKKLRVWTYRVALDVRADEPKRHALAIKNNKETIFPLIDMVRTTHMDIDNFWIKQSFDLRLKSYEWGCKLCHKRPLNEIKTDLLDNPSYGDWNKAMHDKYKNEGSEERMARFPDDYPANFFIDGETIDSLLADATSVDFVRAPNKAMDIWEEGERNPNGHCNSCDLFTVRTKNEELKVSTRG